MDSVNVEGVMLEIVEQGRGEPVVFVHGDISDHRTWAAQLPTFAAHYRAIAYSRRYHFPNLEIPAGADNQMAQHVRDLASLLQALKAVPVHLVGNSWGAFICLRLALQEAGLVRSLVVAEPPVLPLLNVSMPPTPQQVARLLLRRPRAGVALIRTGATIIGPATAAFRRGDLESGMRTFARGVLGADVYDRWSDARLEQARQNVRPLAATFMGKGFESLRDSEIRRLTIPTLLVTGERSLPLFLRLTDRLAELLPNSRRVAVPGASHLMHEDNPEFFNTTVLNFFAALGSS